MSSYHVPEGGRASARRGYAGDLSDIPVSMSTRRSGVVVQVRMPRTLFGQGATHPRKGRRGARPDRGVLGRCPGLVLSQLRPEFNRVGGCRLKVIHLEVEVHHHLLRTFEPGARLAARARVKAGSRDSPPRRVARRPPICPRSLSPSSQSGSSGSGEQRQLPARGFVIPSNIRLFRSPRGAELRGRVPTRRDFPRVHGRPPGRLPRFSGRHRGRRRARSPLLAQVARPW